MKRSKSADPAHDVLGYERQQLDAIFRPETVAVIGATERPGSVGRTIMWNLVSSPFGGTVFPVNARRPNVRTSSRASVVGSGTSFAYSSASLTTRNAIVSAASW